MTGRGVRPPCFPRPRRAEAARVVAEDALLFEQLRLLHLHAVFLEVAVHDVVAGILAAAMKPSLNAIASAVVADLYAPVGRGRDDRHYLRVSRLVTVLAGFAMIGLALV